MRFILVVSLIFIALEGFSQEVKRTDWIKIHIQPTHTLTIKDPQVNSRFYVTVALPQTLNQFEADKLADDIQAWRIAMTDSSEMKDTDTTFDRLMLVLRQEGVLLTSKIDFGKKNFEPAVWYDSAAYQRSGSGNAPLFYSNNMPLKASDMYDENIPVDPTFSPHMLRIKRFGEEKYISATIYYRSEPESEAVASSLQKDGIAAKSGRSSGSAGYYVTFPIDGQFESELDVIKILAKAGVNFEEEPLDQYFELSKALDTGIKSVGTQGNTQEVRFNKKPFVPSQKPNPLMAPQKRNPLQRVQ